MMVKFEFASFLLKIFFFFGGFEGGERHDKAATQADTAIQISSNTALVWAYSQPSQFGLIKKHLAWI